MAGRMRSVATWVVGVLAVVALIASTLAVWARTTVADPDTFGDIAPDVLDDPTVQRALAERLADEVLSTRLERLLDADRVQDLLVRAVELAHGSAIQLLRGDGLRDGISVDEGTISVNVLPLVGRGLQQLQALGLRASWALLAATAVLLVATLVLARARWRVLIVLSLAGAVGLFKVPTGRIDPAEPVGPPAAPPTDGVDPLRRVHGHVSETCAPR